MTPLLFNVYIAPLLRELEEKAKETGCEMINPTLVDDITIAVAGADKVEAMTKAEEIIKRSEKWGEENGIRFDEKKMEWIGLDTEREETWSIETATGWKEEGECVR